MRSFELYLDESGQFINEDKAITPSLIGGILVKKDDLSITKAKDIMDEAIKNVPGNYVHINDISKKDLKLSGKVAVDIMQKIRLIPAYTVIFSNNEYCDDLGDGWFKVLYILGTEYQIVMYVTRELVDKYF